MALSNVLLSFLVMIISFAGSLCCQVPCSSTSTGCCIRGGCGCVDLVGTTSGCDKPCTYETNCWDCEDLEACGPLSYACCHVDDKCGCIDIDDFIDGGWGNASDCIAQCQYCGTSSTSGNGATVETKETP